MSKRNVFVSALVMNVFLVIGTFLFAAPFVSKAHAATIGEPFPYTYQKSEISPGVLDALFDNDGSEYQARYYPNTSFPIGQEADLNPGDGVDMIMIEGQANFFITKYNPDGSYAWTKYSFYSNESTIGAYNSRLALSDSNIIWVANMYDSELDFVVDNNGNTTTIANDFAGQSPAYYTAVLVKYSKNASFQEIGTIPSGYILSANIDRASNAIFIGGGYIGTRDFDIFQDTEFEMTSTDNADSDAFLAKYNADLSLAFAYSWSADDQDISINQIELNATSMVAGLAYNGNTSPRSIDIDPTSGTTNVSLHQHDLSLIKFDLSGNFIWHQTITSSELVGEYPWIDDEWFVHFAMDPEGNIYNIFYSDSNAVIIGDQLYEKTVTGINNVFESFVYKLNADGEVQWSKYIASPTNNVITWASRVFFDTRLQKVIVVGTAYGESIVIDGVTYSSSKSSSSSNGFWLVLSAEGEVESVTFSDFIGAGTLTADSFPNFGMDLINLPNKTIFFYYYSVSANNLQVDFDHSPSNAAYSSVVSGFGRFRVYYQQEYPASGGEGSTGLSMPLAQGCNAMPPGLKVPWLYGAMAQDAQSIKLYFAPGDEPFNNYTVQYGTEYGNYPYGAVDIYNKEMRTLVVDELKPNTRYYFRIRSGNDCAPGEWSNELSAQTKK